MCVIVKEKGSFILTEFGYYIVDDSPPIKLDPGQEEFLRLEPIRASESCEVEVLQSKLDEWTASGELVVILANAPEKLRVARTIKAKEFRTLQANPTKGPTSA